MPKRKHRPDLKHRRQLRALKRQEVWGDLTPDQQLADLRARGHGNCKQARALDLACLQKDELERNQKEARERKAATKKRWPKGRPANV